MTESSGLIRIGEFAKLAKSNLRTLRYYEELGLLLPASRSSGGFRLYREGQLDRMAAIKRLQDLGLSLSEVADAIATDDLPEGPDRVRRLQPLLARQIALTEARMRSLESSLDELDSARRMLVEMCESCDVEFSRESCDPCPQRGEPMQAVLRGLL